MKREVLLIEGSLRVFNEFRELGIKYIQIPEEVVVVEIKEENVSRPKYKPPLPPTPRSNVWEMPNHYNEG